MTAWLWDQNVELEGWFWRPDSEHRFYGRMDHTPQDGSRFHFVDSGPFDPQTREPPLPAGATLHGEALGGTPLTILEFFPATWSWFGTIHSEVNGFATSVLKGRHLDPNVPIEAAGFGASLHRLAELLTGGQVDGGILNPRAADESGLFRGDHIGATLDGDVQLLLHAGEQTTGGRARRTSTVEATVQVTVPEPWQTGRLERTYLDGLRELVGFATRQPSHGRSLGFHPVEGLEGLTVLRQPWPLPDPRQRDVDALALNLAQIGDPAALLASWFSLRARVGAVWSLFFTTLDDPHALLENRFLNLMAFAEGYHRVLRDKPPLTDEEDTVAKQAIRDAIAEPHVRRVYNDALRHANTQTQGERIDELIQDARTALDGWELDSETVRREVVHTRNWMTHWGEKTPHVIEDPHQLAVRVRQLELVLYVALLHDLGLEIDEIRATIGSGWRLEGLP